MQPGRLLWYCSKTFSQVYLWQFLCTGFRSHSCDPHLLSLVVYGKFLRLHQNQFQILLELVVLSCKETLQPLWPIGWKKGDSKWGSHTQNLLCKYQFHAWEQQDQMKELRSIRLHAGCKTIHLSKLWFIFPAWVFANSLAIDWTSPTNSSYSNLILLIVTTTLMNFFNYKNQDCLFIWALQFIEY